MAIEKLRHLFVTQIIIIIYKYNIYNKIQVIIIIIINVCIFGMKITVKSQELLLCTSLVKNGTSGKSGKSKRMGTGEGKKQK